MADSLIQLATELTRAIVPIIIVIGMIGNSLNIAVLTRPALYNHACSRYFLALACDNLFFSSIMLIHRLLADGYQHDLTKSSHLSCRLVTYFSQISVVLPAYFIVLASIDRYCVSSTNIHLRKFSNIKVTRWSILFVIILVMLFHVNTAILIDFSATNKLGCRIRADTIYKQVYAIIQIINIAIIAPGLVALFGIMTIYNIKRVRVIPPAMSCHRRTENQLAVMLLVQVGTYIVLTVPVSVIYLLLVFPNTIQTTSVFYLARITCQLFLFFSIATPFFLYLLSSGTYRRELVQLVHRILRSRCGNQIYRITNTITNTVVNQSIQQPTNSQQDVNAQ